MSPILKHAYVTFGSLMVLAGFTRTESTIYYADPVRGNDGNRGLADSPFRSLCACISVIETAGDECRLHAGNYSLGNISCVLSGVHGTLQHPIVISSVGDGPVVLDGTIAVVGNWTPELRKKESISGNVLPARYSTAAPAKEIFQLFVDGKLQMLARHPNAKWTDKSVFLANKNWMKSTIGGIHHSTVLYLFALIFGYISSWLTVVMPRNVISQQFCNACAPS
eukprot:m.803633 g.803633  ORF g.803633 m.803633 type:complete len:223 (-) comp23367_c0_seq5:2758-3426(-)